MNLGQLFKQLLGIRQFVIVDDRINGDVDLRIKLMGIAAQLGDVIDAVASGGTGAKMRSTYINGVGTVVYCRDATLQILCGCQ